MARRSIACEQIVLQQQLLQIGELSDLFRDFPCAGGAVEVSLSTQGTGDSETMRKDGSTYRDTTATTVS